MAADALVVEPPAVYLDDQVGGAGVTLQVSNRNAEGAPLTLAGRNRCALAQRAGRVRQHAGWAGCDGGRR